MSTNALGNNKEESGGSESRGLEQDLQKQRHISIARTDYRRERVWWLQDRERERERGEVNELRRREVKSSD
jgi:hypothetical protein